MKYLVLIDNPIINEEPKDFINLSGQVVEQEFGRLKAAAVIAMKAEGITVENLDELIHIGNIGEPEPLGRCLGEVYRHNESESTIIVVEIS